MKITDVRVRIVKKDDSKLKAVASVTFDDCFVFIHGIQCWFFRKRNNRSFENMPTEKLAFHRDKLKSVISIYNELDSMICKKS